MNPETNVFAFISEEGTSESGFTEEYDSQNNFSPYLAVW